MNGESAKRLESLEFSEFEMSTLPRPEQVYLEEPERADGLPTKVGLRALHPLVHYDAASGQVYFLNACRGKKGIEYLSYATGDSIRREQLGADQRELLARVTGQPFDDEAAQISAPVDPVDEPAASSSSTESGARRIGEFELLSRLGQGGMGVVYRAWQPSLGRQVALKCMLRAGDPKSEARFSREIRALGRVEHPNVVKVFTSGSEADQWFYAMELIEGAELSRVCEALAGNSVVEIDEGHWRQALTTACELARSQETLLSTTHLEAEAVKVAAAPVSTTTPSAELPAATSKSGRGHVKQVVEIVRQIAEATHALHEAGVIHRDIKPGNIILTTDGGHPVLMDLGLAQLADETDGRVTRTRQFVGTLRYASPEQVLSAGKVDRRTDVYSLVATLWELLTLRPIFGATDELPTPELMLKIQTTDPEKPRKHNSHVPQDLEAIVLKCLEKDRSRRYLTAAELAADLERFLKSEPVLAQPPSVKYLAGKFVRRYRVPLATIIGILLFVIIGTVIAFLNVIHEHEATIAALESSETNRQLAENRYDALQLETYANRIAIAERELTLNQDINVATAALDTVPPNLRGWEWRYLMRLRNGDQPPLKQHRSGVWMVVFSPDGKQLASSSVDGTVIVWDAATRKPLHTFNLIPPYLQALGKAIPVMTVAFSPDGRHLAAGSLIPNPVDLRNSEGLIVVWETTSWKEVVKFKQNKGLVTCLAFSADSKYIASASLNKDNSFLIWEVHNSAKPIAVLRGHTGSVNQLRFSPKDSSLVSASTDGTLKIWSTINYQLLRTIEAHPAPVHDVAITPDGAQLVSAGMDGTTRVWNTATGEQVLLLRGHTGSTLGVAVSPDGSRIATSGFDNTVRLWDRRTGEEKITLRGHKDTVFGVDFSSDGQKLASGSFDNTVRLWDAGAIDERTRLSSFEMAGADSLRVNSLAYSPDRQHVAMGCWDATVRIWDTNTRKEVLSLPGHKIVVFSVAYSPDGGRIASASWDGTVKVRDAFTGRELFSCPHATPVHSVAFSPDGTKLASGCWDGLVKIWDARTGQELHSCDRHLLPALCLAFSPDSKRLASASGDRTVSVWDVSTGKEILRCSGHEAAIHGVAFSPDGTRLASAGWDKTVRLWEVPTAVPTTAFSLLGPSACRELFVTPIGNDKGHEERINSVSFSADGKLLASASDDKTVRIWDTKTGKQRQVLRHRGWVWSVAFCPGTDRCRLATASWASGAWVTIWDLNVDL